MLLCLGVERGEVVEVGGFVLFLVDSIVVLRNSKVQEGVLAPGPLRRGLGLRCSRVSVHPHVDVGARGLLSTVARRTGIEDVR